MLGGDKFKNNLGNQMIIKCHKCGDTDLRYVGFPRTEGYPSGYVCGKGHETWGAVDEYIEEERWGQTDREQSRVGDCCCESLGCDLPDSIKVQFEGILGVQAKESCSRMIYEDVKSRSYNPITLCGPCCSGYYEPGDNGPWWISCGCDKAQGPCTSSSDGANAKGPLCLSYSDIIYSGCNLGLTSGVYIANYDTITFYDQVPATRPDGNLCSNGTIPNCNYRRIFEGPWEGLGQQCNLSIPQCCASGLRYPYLSGPFFEGGYPEAYAGSIGPSFITEGPSTIGNIWDHAPHSIKFLVREQIQVKWNDACDPEYCCVSGKRTYYAAVRNHPTTDPTGNSGFTWTITQEGIADKVVYSLPCDDTGLNCFAEWTSSEIDLNFLISDYCDLDNSVYPCTNCNNSIGEMTAELCNDDDDGSRRFWPFRVPYFKDVNDRYQYVRENESKYPTNGECNCGNADNAISVCQSPPPGPDDPQVPDFCSKSLVYPNCLAQGTDQCYDVDSRYRIACSNPGDYFTVTLYSDGMRDLLDYRYSIDYSSFSTGMSTKDLENITVRFNPIWEGRRTSTYDSGGEIWSFPKSSNPLCANAHRIGYVWEYGDPTINRQETNNIAWDSINYPESGQVSAIGIVRAKLGEVFEDSKDKVQQPHCLRRVENPDLRNKATFYQVNTGDVSNQNIILDRYYPTSNDFDWLWKDYPLAEPNYPSGQPFINRQGDRGITDLLNSQLFPFSFISRSGSVEEPEIVAIIHSEKGKGGQIAFQTIPVSYDTDTFIDPSDQIQSRDGSSCEYKTRVTAYGYGVMYPLIDDPIWSQEIDTTEWWDTPYDPNNPIFDTTRQRKSTFEYPVWIPGTGYEIGDKIEFRCWKCLEGAEERNPSAITGESESVWEEECVESIIATATVTELNDERLAPTKVSGIPGLKIILDIQPSGTDRYRETWKVNRASITGGKGYNINDVIPIRFSDTDGLNEQVYYDIYPSAIVIETGVSGVIVNTDIIESGSFYKIIRTGGLRWYEFDEVDDNGDYLISVGNCPCSFDICDPDCNGCVSKEMYPSGHEKLDAAPNGFPGTPRGNCVTVDGITEIDQNTNQEVPVLLYCPSSSETVDCGTNATFTARWGSVSGLTWLNLNSGRCKNNCRPETSPSSIPENYGDTERVDCVCSKPYSGSVMYISGWSPRNEYHKCWPLNKSYEFEGREENYARAACFGEPVTPGQRAYMDGRYVMPHKKPQYKYQWLPNVSGFLGGVENYLDDDPSPQAVDAIKDAFLSIDACNPGKYDRFNKSYKWITKDNSGKPPCRKKLNSDDNIPSGVDTPRTIDNYCRAYGFYQQRQPTCNVVYRGQYIMRTAVKAGIFSDGTYWTGGCLEDEPVYPNGGHVANGCDPIIADIAIYLNRFESQLDISVGAPYNQDYLIPEQLPIPVTGDDGFLESRADSWGYPSLVANDVKRYFDHGFYEPNRYGEMIEVLMPENSDYVNPTTGQQIPNEVFAVNPLFHVYDVEGGGMFIQDQRNGFSFANTNVWDWPDPRSNCSGACDVYDVPLDVLYPSGNVPLPSSLKQNNFSYEYLYPWENVRPTDDIDHYAMFKNNSAELVVGEIEECENCRGSFLINNRNTPDATNVLETFYYGDIVNYTDIRMYSSSEEEDAYGNIITSRHYILFRAFGKNNNAFTQQAFKDVIDDYINTWTDRMGEDFEIDLYGMLSLDVHRSVLFNMLFNGAANDKLDGLTKVDILYVGTTEKPQQSSYDPGGEQVTAFGKLFTEDRCEYYQKTGTIKSVNVLNGGSGYAFELEERVAPTGFIQSIPEMHISGSTRVEDNERRRETYALEDISLSGVGTSGHYIGEVFEIIFNDKDAVRKGITYTQKPSIVITDVDDDGYITDYEISSSGVFYKYIKTGEHRAFPTAIVLNNYWDYPNGSQNFGRHAKLVPVIGVDPKDPDSYGKIKRVDVAFGGIEYVQPGTYWGITTTLGDYDNYGNLLNGLDIQHLVDPCKYNIHGDGITSQQVKEYRAWLSNPENYQSGTMFFPEELSYWDPEMMQGDPFTKSVKYYYNTNSGMTPTKWADKVKNWETVIVSGSCPVNASGGLLNRTYSMALVEDPTMYDSAPYVGNCSKSQCDQLIDRSLVDLAIDPFDAYPENADPKDYGDPCPVFTIYDAHRYAIARAANMVKSMDVTPAPYLWGCDERISVDGFPVAASLFCYNTLSPIVEGGMLSTQGAIKWPMLSNPQDLCSNVDYSLYAEFGKWTNNGNTRNRPVMRSKAITYGMGGTPIKMTVSYNDDSVPVAYSGCQDPHLSGICQPCPDSSDSGT